MAEVAPGGRASKLPLLIMGAVVTLAVLVTVAIVAFPRTESFEPGSPEAVVQQFIEAGLDDDETSALDLLTSSARRSCVSEFDDRQSSPAYFGDELRAILQSTTIDGDDATVDIEFRRSNADDPFDSTTRTFESRYTLIRVGDEWQVDRAGWPSAFVRCTEGGS